MVFADRKPFKLAIQADGITVTKQDVVRKRKVRVGIWGYAKYK